MEKISICENHLAEFYTAIKAGDLKRMDTIEHELTNEEKCVACSFVFKTQGTVREALEVYLNSQGLDANIELGKGVRNEFFYWGLRLLVFFTVFGAVMILSAVIKRIVAHGISPFSLIEFTIVGLAALVIFLLVDDKFLD